MTTGVCTTISNSFRLPVFGSTCSSSPRCTRMTTLSKCVTSMLLRRFLFVKRNSSHDLGSARFWWNVHGPGPIKFDAISESSPSVAAGSKTGNRGELRSASGASESSGRIGSPPFPPFTESRHTRVGKSERAMRRMFV